MRQIGMGIFGAAALLGSLFLTTEASAVQPVRQGTIVVAAERLVSSNFAFGQGPTGWYNQFFGAPAVTPFGSPRLGADYFIIDGLSLGGHVGFGLYAGGGNAQGYLALLSRVGYAFSLTRTLDFWPRVGAGLVVYPGDTTTGVITMEGMFLYNFNKMLALEFGPALDVPLGDTFSYGADVYLGANAGLALNF
jgi:hypothetical protein